MPRGLDKEYRGLLKKYITSQNEENLYYGQQFSREFIEKEISPEEVISIHKNALMDVYPEMPEKVLHSFDFLIEMMIHYGLALREHQSLLRKQEEIQMEMNVAAKVQSTLLKTKKPDFKELDIGFVTEPAKKINGDYIYFLHDNYYEASVAVADVMGKGIPAALCMSMIKYGMDSLKHENTSPRKALDIVNRIIEKSISNSMFISMFYGEYDARDSSFSYASAGHEPALLYRASEGSFVELDAKGLLLGINRYVQYEEKSVVLEDGDFIAIMTDGVTEIRTEQGFMDEDIIKSIMLEVTNQPAQSIAETIYNRLSQLQHFQLRDDFTIVILKKEGK